jgi:hypothetical protein
VGLKEEKLDKEEENRRGGKKKKKGSRQSNEAVSGHVWLFYDSLMLTEFEIEQARLTHVFQPTTDLANFSLFEAHALTRAPAKHSEGTSTHLAFL